MRKQRFIGTCAVLMALLCGCGPTPESLDRLFLGDTVVNIPLRPEATEPSATGPTLSPTESPTDPPETVPQATAAAPKSSGTSTTAKRSSSKQSSSKSSSAKSTSKVKATEPAETIPPETEPPVTEDPEPAVYEISDYIPAGLEYAIADQINACRAEAGLDSLCVDGTLCGVASVRAYEVRVLWSHTRPNGGGWQSALSDYGVSYSAAAEELVHTSGYDAASIVSKWMGNSSSQANLLSADFTTIGVGAYAVNGETYLAAIFIG